MFMKEPARMARRMRRTSLQEKPRLRKAVPMIPRKTGGRSRRTRPPNMRRARRVKGVEDEPVHRG
jgi:hypothetical protein